MDDKYIENVGMADIDEGTWDQLKARASGVNQMRKNIFSRGNSDVKDVQFDSLFKKFLSNCISTLEDFHNVISPKIDANKMTPQQEKKIANLFALRALMKKMERIPIREANLFTRPFSALGAQASGNLDNIISVYQKLLRNYYTSFINDAGKLNLVPKEYLGRKLASINPLAKTFLHKFSMAVGNQASAATTSSTSPASTPISSPTTTPSTSSAPAPAPVSTATPTSSPSSVTTTASTPTSSPVAGTSAPASTTPTNGDDIDLDGDDSAYPSSSVPLVEKQPPQKTFWLANEAIRKIITDLSKGLSEMAASDDGSDDIEDAGLNMSDLIRKYLKRNATKAEYPFPKPPVELKDPSGKGKSVWVLRYKYAKDIAGHQIDFYQEDLDAHGNEIAKDEYYQPLLKFDAKDIVGPDAKINTGFDIMNNIQSTNPRLAGKIREGEAATGKKLTDTGLNQKMAVALDSVIRAEAPEASRGLRQTNDIGKPDQEIGTNPNDPPAGPPETLKTTDTKVPPEQQSRYISTATGDHSKGQIPPELLRGTPNILKQEKEKQEKQAAKASAVSNTVSKPTVKKGVSKPVSKSASKPVNKKTSSATPNADDYEKRKQELGINVPKRPDEDDEDLKEFREYFTF